MAWGAFIAHRSGWLGATAQLQSSFFDHLHIVAGGRLVRIDVTDNDLTGFRSVLTSSNVAKTDTTRFLPQVGAAFDITKNITVFAVYSEGMRPLPYLLSTSPMKPELSQQMEAGIKLNTDSGFSATLAAFEVKRQNVPVSVSFVSVQTGEQRSRGFEMNAVYQPNRNWSFLGSYAYTDTKVIKDTNAAFVGKPLPACRKIRTCVGKLFCSRKARSRVFPSVQDCMPHQRRQSSSGRHCTIYNSGNLQSSLNYDALRIF